MPMANDDLDGGLACAGDLRRRRTLNPATPQFAIGPAQEEIGLDPDQQVLSGFDSWIVQLRRRAWAETLQT